MKCFLLIGQSNMAGRGNLNEVDKISDKRIFMRRDSLWIHMEEPLDLRSGDAGIGPAPSFALDYVNHYDEEIGLIQCAVGGTSITQWQPGGELLNNALENVSSLDSDDKVIGILWAQGETDGRSYENSGIYTELFFNMLSEIDRNERLKDRPFIMSDMPPFYFDNEVYIYSEIISKKIKEISKSSDRFGFVSSEGLLPKEDNLHYNSKSYRELGKRFFKEYIFRFGDYYNE